MTNPAVTKGMLIDRIAHKCDLNAKNAEALVKTFFDTIANTLREGNRVEIRGFGSFEVRHYDAYTGRNPRTGEKVPVPAKRAPFFNTGKNLLMRINQGELGPLDDDELEDDED